MIGQDHVSQTLYNALKSSRLPHALLFTGPRGVGKTSSARILAKSLKCTNAKDFVPCNVCSICQEIVSGSNLDVIEIDGASHNGVDSIRELRETIAYMPSSGRYKIYIIDEVHMLSTSAFNALLKTLEEPPPHVIFIFATTEAQKIPLTILSRVQRFDFRRIPTRLLTDRLQKICDKENVSVEPEALWMIARQSEGSARDSQSLLDQIITFSGGKLTLQKTVDALGLTDRQLLVDTLGALITRSTAEILKILEKIYFSGSDAKVFGQELLEETRNLLLVKLSTNLSLVDLPDSEIESLKGLSVKLSSEDIHLLFDMALKGISDLQKSSDTRLALEMLLLRMSAAPRIVDILGMNSASTSASVSAQGAPPASAPADLKVDKNLPLGENWAQTVAKIRQTRPSLAAKLEHVAPLRMEANKIHLGLPKDKQFLFEQLTDPKTVSTLSVFFKEIWSQTLVPAFEVIEQTNVSPAEMTKTKTKDREVQVMKEVEGHPMIKKAQETFKAQIKSIKETS